MNSYLDIKTKIRYLKKGEFLECVYMVYGDLDLESLLTLRDSLNILISSMFNNSIDKSKLFNMEGYVRYK